MVQYSDTHEVSVPDNWNAIDFATQILGNAPTWLMRLLDLRDRIVGAVGFATQPSQSRSKVEIAVGSSAGPFTFTEVSPDAVHGGNRDRHMVFGSIFRVEQRSGRSYGVLRTSTHSLTGLGAVYLTAIWPAHKLLIQRILRSGMAR